MSMPLILIKVHNNDVELRFHGNSILQRAPIELLYELYLEGEVTCGREYAISPYMVPDTLGIQETIARYDKDQEYYLVSILNKDSYRAWFREQYPMYLPPNLHSPLQGMCAENVTAILAGFLEVLLVDKDDKGKPFLNKCKHLDAEHLNQLRTKAISLIPYNLFRDED